jgi:tRNA threonylcarbamoyladenosine biosynthesis protein TsaB
VRELILAVETTHAFGSLALLHDGEVIEEMLLHAPDGYGELLFARLRELLERNAVTLAEVDCFAAASGPGSFTGVRVGLACIKGLAEAVGKPCVAVSNLAALATFGSGPRRAVVLDARRGEVYAAVYDARGGLAAPETVTRFAAWLENLPEGEVEFISPDFAPFAAVLPGTRFADAKVTAAPRALAAAIARVARERLRSGEALDPAALDANYVRRSDAELFHPNG